jgi:Uncharacterized protein conserved in bacteria (DUF2313).
MTPVWIWSVLGERELTALDFELIDELPTWIRDDPDVRAVLHCFAKESERQREMAQAIRDDCIPIRAASRGLGWWERYFGLTVEPEGWTLEQRRSVILDRLRREPPLGSGLSWQAAITALGCTYEEHADEAKVTILAPFPPGSEALAFVKEQVPRLPSWPCHLEPDIISVEGFVLDLSELDAEPFEA